MFKEDEKTVFPKKLTQKERMHVQGKSNSPAERKTKTTGKRTGGRPTSRLQTSGLSLQAEIPVGTPQANETATPSSDKHEEDDQSSDSSEDITPSPKRQNKNQTPPTNAPEPLRKSTRNRQSALSHAFGNPVPINAIEDKQNEETKQSIRFKIDSPPARQENAYPSLKSLIQELGFTETTPQFKACIKLIEAISPKSKINQTEIVDLISPPNEDEPTDTNNDILFINTKICPEGGEDDDQNDDEEEHENQGEKTAKQNTQPEK